MADGDGGLQVVDISDPQNKGSIDTSGSAIDVHVIYPYAYVAAKENGLVIIDLGDSLNPEIESTLAPSTVDNVDKVTSVYGLGSSAYLLDSDSGLAVI